MLIRAGAAAGTLALLVASSSEARDPVPEGWALDSHLAAVALGGALTGLGVRTDRALVSSVELDGGLSVTRGPWKLKLPLALSYRRTFGASLPQGRGRAQAELRWRSGPRLRAGAEIGLAAVWRPGWPDLYQPLGGGRFVPTDRHSHWDRRWGGWIAGIPLRHHHARLDYRYTLADYTEDPAFEPILAPTHLAPLDHQKHALDLSWRYLGGGWKLGAAAEMFWREDFFLFARDAGTGKTHAGAGGPPPNPLQVRRGVEPSIEGAMDLLRKDLQLSAAYGFEIVEDTFQGYGSFTGHHPSLRVEYAVHPRVALEARGAIAWRRFGPGSYAAGTGHPALTDGDRRVEHREAVSISVKIALVAGLTLDLGGRFLARQSNFPAYRPGVFPASRSYAIEWSFTNWSATAGVQYQMGSAREDGPFQGFLLSTQERGPGLANKR